MNRTRSFWLAVILLFATIVLVPSAYFRWINFGIVVGPYRLNHWLGWIGVSYIAVVTPVYHLVKKRGTNRIQSMLDIHCLGNLIAFMGISIHFAHQIGRAPQFYPDLGTGVALYSGMVLNIATGFLKKFQILSENYATWRFIHLGITLSFYLIIIIHILHGLRII
jgi:hypothetical protein